MPHRTVNATFERVIVVNLDRRPDRMASVAAQLRALAIDFERFPAIDGKDPALAAEWRTYAQSEPPRLPPGARPVTSWREFYLDYDSDLARVAFFEAQRGRAIATPGAWGLLCSMSTIVERAVAEGWQSILVLEDDVLFHQSTVELFDRFVAQLPPDWSILQLGAMQLHWEDNWISWYSDNLYRCQGSSIGAHAFALRGQVLPELLERSRVRDLPFDIGALHTIKRRHAARCFTMFPNLAIQSAADSDIGMSTMFFREARRTDNIYRWYLPEYGLAAIERRDAAHVSKRPAVSASSAPPALAARTRGAILSAFGRKARSRGASTEPGASSGPASSAKAPGPTRLLGGQPPLKVRSLREPKTYTSMALVIGLATHELVRVLDVLHAQHAGSNLEPVLVTDSDAFELFRARRLAFEYLPAPALRERLEPGLDWDLYVLRRLALLRRKWQPVRIVGFGPAAAELLQQWRDSPFEDDSIHRVAIAPFTSNIAR